MSDKKLEEKRIQLLLLDVLRSELISVTEIISSEGVAAFNNGNPNNNSVLVGYRLLDINLGYRKSVPVHKVLIDQVLIDYKEMLENKIKELEA